MQITQLDVDLNADAIEAENLRREAARIRQFFDKLEQMKNDDRQREDFERSQALMSDTQRSEYNARLEFQKQELIKLEERIKEENKRLELVKQETARQQETYKAFETMTSARKQVMDQMEKAPAPEQGVKNYQFDVDGLDHQRDKRQLFAPMDQPIASEQERHFWETHQYNVKTGGFDLKKDKNGNDLAYDPYKFGPMGQGEYDRRMVKHLEMAPGTPDVKPAEEDPAQHPGRQLRQLYVAEGLIKKPGMSPGKSGGGKSQEQQRPEDDEDERQRRKTIAPK